MTLDATTGAGGSEVMASVDDAADAREFVIADVSRDDAWVSIRFDEAPGLDAWR